MYNYFIGIKRRNTLPIAHRLILNRDNDQYIISYPRSGSTWLRTILTNVLLPNADSNPDIFNSILPGVSLRNVIKLNRLSSPRIIHSHTWYRQDILKAVYLIRDGRDVLVSYYHYMVTRRGRAEKESFSTFFDLYRRGIYGHLWHENIESWLTSGRNMLENNLLVIRFEDMKKNTRSIIEEIVCFLDIQASSSNIEEAIRKSNIERMREIESTRISIDLQDPNMSFYRGGKTGQWRNTFTHEIEQRFYDISSKALELAGYLT